MYNYKITISYDGTKYNGWQRQGNTDNTIQGKLNEIIGRYLSQEVDVAGSGRTDRGVHARAQVASFKVKQAINLNKFVADINGYLPQDIRVLCIEQVDERFHARLCAVSKTYQYVIDNGEISDVFSRKYVCRIEEKLDISAMKEAARNLVGTYDYISFCGNKHFKKSSVRTVFDIKIVEAEGIIVILYTGDGFLQNMVRIMTGTLIEVGLGKRNADSMKEIIAAKSRDVAGFMAPPEGLFLYEVKY